MSVDATITVETSVPPAAASGPGPRRLPELLAPAGDWECAKAAVENGADAIYFGLDRFNARMRARNFTEADLPALMEFLHRRGVRGYVTFNTLVFTDELPDAVDYLRSIIAAGVDAAIVQDVGICRLIRRLSPDFPIHGSTQMTVTSAAGVEFARRLGCNLVVLARENTIREIASIRQAIETDGKPTFPLEVFVHGALCVAYSGQCLTSEALGGRSANRGECAQACRMPYELLSDGRPVELGDRRYLLSPQDLAGLDVLPELVRAGVASLKIEGRLKSPEYVASITRVYRKALDQLSTSNATSTSAPEPNAGMRDRYELEMAFSRGLHTGWFGGIDNQRLVHARFGKKRGVYLGEVIRVERDAVWVKAASDAKPGDGVVFDCGRPEDPEEGGRIYDVRSASASASASAPGQAAQIRFGFGRNAIDFSRIRPGDRLWKTDDPELGRELKRTFEGDNPRFQRPIDIEVHGHLGTPMTIVLRDGDGNVVQVSSNLPLATAEKSPLSTERLTDQLGRTGGTPFRLGQLHNRLEGPVILPVSELNRMRREAIAQLDATRARPRRWQLNHPSGDPTGVQRVEAIGNSGIESTSGPDFGASIQPQLRALVRTMPQLEAALRCGIDTLYCDFEDPKKYREAVRTVRESGSCRTAPPSVWVAPPRITKPGEEWILSQVRSCDADGYLVRNYDHLAYFSDCRRIGDFSLNVANPLTAEYFIREHRLEYLTASYDLNIAQLEALLTGAPPQWFEVTIHQHMPMFHMEHCVFCAFLSTGTDYRNCGRPCDQHQVVLRDRVGRDHPLKADAGCRNTVYNARAQTGAEFVDRLVALGQRRFRVEFVNESADEVQQTLARYRALFRGEISGTQLWRELKLDHQLGVTRGQLEASGARKVFPRTDTPVR